MFKKNGNGSAGSVGVESQANNLLSGTTITGDIQTEGSIRIDGVLIGTIEAKGKVVIGETGKVEGEIRCNNAEIFGSIKATITVTELLSLKSTANLTGDIITNKLAIEPGAVFTGSCSMGAVIKEISNNGEQSSEPAGQQAAQETA